MESDRPSPAIATVTSLDSLCTEGFVGFGDENKGCLDLWRDGRHHTMIVLRTFSRPNLSDHSNNSTKAPGQPSHRHELCPRVLVW